MNAEDQEWEPPSEAEMKLITKRRDRSNQISKIMSGYLLKGYKMLGSACAKCDTILLQDRQGINYCVACSELDSDTDKDDPAINESAAMSMTKELERASAAAALSPSGPPDSSLVSSSRQASAVTGHTDVRESIYQTNAPPSSKVTSSQDPSRSEGRGKILREDPSATLSISSIDVQSFTTNVISGTKDKVCPKYSSSAPKSATEVGGDSGYSTIHHTAVASGAGGDGVYSASDLADSVHVSRLQDKINWANQELQSTHSIEYSIHLCQLIKIAAEAIVAVRNARL